MYVIYLKDEDLLTAEHFPAAALINEAANSDIVEFVFNLVQGIGRHDKKLNRGEAKSHWM